MQGFKKVQVAKGARSACRVGFICLGSWVSVSVSINAVAATGPEPVVPPGSIRAGEVLAAAAAENFTSHVMKHDRPSEESSAVLATPPVFSLPSRLELTAGTDGLVQLSDVSKQVSLFGEARYRLTRTMQLGGSLAYRFQSGNQTSDSAFQILLGPTLNFFPADATLESAFFVAPQLGVTTGRTMFGDVVVNSNTQFTMALTVGKRFRLGEGVAYAPSIGVVKERDFSPSVVVQPISISVFF